MALLVSFLKLISLIFTYINRFLINATFLRDTKRILIHLLQATEVNGVVLPYFNNHNCHTCPQRENIKKESTRILIFEDLKMDYRIGGQTNGIITSQTYAQGNYFLLENNLPK